MMQQQAQATTYNELCAIYGDAMFVAGINQSRLVQQNSLLTAEIDKLQAQVKTLEQRLNSHKSRKSEVTP